MAKKTTSKSKPEVVEKRATKPVEKPKAAVAPPVKPVALSAKPLAPPAKPVTPPEKAVAAPAKPVTSAAKPVTPMAKAVEPPPKEVVPPKALVEPSPAPPSPKPVKAKRVVKKAEPKSPAYTQEDVALRAYFLSEKRRNEWLPGDEHQDWLEAERQLVSESTKKKAAKKA